MSYRHAAGADRRFAERARELLAAPGTRRVCELGAGANPLFGLDDLRAQSMQCVLVDASAEELGKAPPGYVTVAADAVAFLRESDPFDLIVSRTVAEHVRDAAAFHGAVAHALVPGGRAAHFFPTLWWPTFVVNRVLPEHAAARLLRVMQPGRDDHDRHRKFPARYEWCRGPTARQLRRLQRTGLIIDEYVGFFGQDYLGHRPWVSGLEHASGTLLLHRPVPALTSYAWVVMRRPARAKTPA